MKSSNPEELGFSSERLLRIQQPHEPLCGERKTGRDRHMRCYGMVRWCTAKLLDTKILRQKHPCRKIRFFASTP